MRCTVAWRSVGAACPSVQQQTLPLPCARVHRMGTAAGDDRGESRNDRTHGPDLVQFVCHREGWDALEGTGVGRRTRREQRRAVVTRKRDAEERCPVRLVLE